MKKLLAVALVTLSLGGCAQLQKLQDVISIGTASVANPVTKTRLNQLEAATTLVFAGLNTWKQSCAQRLINTDCEKQIGAVQVYTRQIPPYLAQLREFVKNDDQVNATVVYNNISKLVTTVKAQAAAANVPMGN